MANQQLLDYIEKCTQQNFSQAQITAELLKVGWAEADIKAAFSVSQASTKPLPSIEAGKTVVKIEKSEAIKEEPKEKVKDDSFQLNTVKDRVQPKEQITPKDQLPPKDQVKPRELKEQASSPELKPTLAATKKSWRWPLLKFNKTLVLIVSAAVLLLAGAGALAYYYYFPTPARVLSKMVLNLNSVRSLSYTSEIKLEFKVDESLAANPIYSEFIKTNQAVDPLATSSASRPSDFNRAHEITFNINGQTDSQNNSQANLKNLVVLKVHSSDISGGALGFEERLVNNWAYLNLDLPNLGFIDLSVLKDQWIKFSASSSLDNLVSTGGSASQSVSANSQASLDGWLAKTAQLKDIFSQAQIFKLDKALPSEQINNSATYHYSFTVDKAALEDFIVKASRVLSDKSLSEKDIAQVKDSLTRLDSVKGEIWIGKTDFLPYKLLVNLAMKSKPDDTIKINKVAFTWSGQNFNQPIEVKEPASAKTIKEIVPLLLSELSLGSPNQLASSSLATSTDLGNSLATSSSTGLATSSLATTSPVLSTSSPIKTGTTTATLDNGLDSDKDGLTDYQEIHIYHTNPHNKDTDGDGYSDGEEVKNGYNPNGPGKLISPKKP